MNIEDSNSTFSICLKKLMVRSEGKYYALEIAAINWIYAKDSQSILFMEDGREFTIRSSLHILEEKLKEASFVRSHRNYLINYNKIEMYDISGFVLINNQNLPVSRKNRKEVEEKFCFLK